MKKHLAKTKKAAASIYIVIFTTTLLGVIALSFTRIMLAESLRTTNYSLSQSAYNSAQAGIEDAKIVLLRYQNCINFGKYSDSTGSSKSCADYEVIDHHRVGSIDHYQMRKAESLSNTALIRLLSEQLDIRTFNEKLPTMHEIFLKVVGE